MSDPSIPAFAWPARAEDQPGIDVAAWQEVTPEWAWGGASGKGVRVCVVDSGIDGDHPLVKGALRGGVIVERGPDGPELRDEDHGDLFGHGTACAGIIHGLAPDAELYSVRILGPNLKGGGTALLAGVEWAIENRMDVINLSLSTRKPEHLLPLHELADQAYFKGTVIVAAANNVPVSSYPWLFSSVISVASHMDKDPHTFYYNPNPPVEFTAPGVDLETAWAGGSTAVGTGNSFAAPHITGICAAILSKHPHLTPFQVKTTLYYTAKNVREALAREKEEAGGG
ncbi:MAG: S8 family peptidase [Chloroflexota bacterium]